MKQLSIFKPWKNIHWDKVSRLQSLDHGVAAISPIKAIELHGAIREEGKDCLIDSNLLRSANEK